jgi:hypothetical protein
MESKMQLFTLKNASISRTNNFANVDHVAAHAYATTKRTSWYPAFGSAATWSLIG